MKATREDVPAELAGFTPAMLAERKLTLADMPPSDYDHETQTRKFPDSERTPWLAPDTMFDGEKS